MTPVAYALVGLTTVWGLYALAQGNGIRRALSATLSSAAFLVPAAMTVTALSLIAHLSGRTPSENPFDVRLRGPTPLGTWLAFLIGSVTLAGHVGLLRAWRTGQRIDGYAFYRGVRDHTATMALGRLGLFTATYAIAQLGPRSLLNVLYIVPSLLVAPLLAAAANHPRQPLAALLATLRTTLLRFDTVGNLVFAQVVFLVGSLFCLERMAGMPIGDWSTLAHGGGSLSYNLIPFGQLGARQPWFAALGVLLQMVASSVFLAGYFLRLEERPEQDAGEAKPQPA